MKKRTAQEGMLLSWAVATVASATMEVRAKVFMLAGAGTEVRDGD